MLLLGICQRKKNKRLFINMSISLYVIYPFDMSSLCDAVSPVMIVKGCSLSSFQCWHSLAKEVDMSSSSLCEPASKSDVKIWDLHASFSFYKTIWLLVVCRPWPSISQMKLLNYM